MNHSSIDVLPNARTIENPFFKTPPLKNARIDLGKREILIAFRFLVFLAVTALLFSKESAGLPFFSSKMISILAFYFLTIAVMPVLKSQWIENKNFITTVFLADTLFVSAMIYLGG